MLFLLLIASAISGILYFVLDSASEYLVEKYLEESEYAEERNAEAVSELQNYITSGDLASRDAEALALWVKKQKLLILCIYKDGIQVFDSRYPDQEIWDEEIVPADYDWINYDTVEFSDGMAEIQITGAYRYQIYSRVWILELAVCFFVFLMVVLFGIRRKMIYIRLLSNEVEALEGGSLHCPITVKGNDELSVLAEGLDSMRKSFLESQKKEEEIYLQNQHVITEMSHDLRTPVTSIILYSEILKAGKYRDDAQRDSYIEKIGRKAFQLKERTDQLLGYSLLSEKRNPPKMERAPFKDVFYDLLSEACGYLEQTGFRIDSEMLWPEVVIAFNADYASRIVDNIVSNITKYADPQEPVRITQTEDKNMVGLLVQNRIRRADGNNDGTRVGIKNVCSMMEEMGGTCLFEKAGLHWEIGISFPVIEWQNG